VPGPIVSRRGFAMRVTTLCVLFAARSGTDPEPAAAAETGHFCPGLINVREYIVPPRGFYYLQYNGFYWSTAFNDRHGNRLTSAPIDTVMADLVLKYDSWLIFPAFVWGSGWKVLGAEHAAFVSTSISGFESRVEIRVGDYQHVDVQSNSGWGDLVVQPVWLGWRWTRAEAAFAYAFYAPVGKFEPERLDNIGLGYWSHVIKLTGVYYPVADRSTVLLVTGVYESNSNREGADLVPGSRFALDGGLSQYLSKRIEVGIPVYATWQVTADTGADAVDDALDRAYGIGIQAGYWAIPNRLQFSVRYLTQFGVRDRFEGDYAALNFLYIF